MARPKKQLTTPEPLPTNDEGNASFDRTLQEYLSTQQGADQMRKTVMQVMRLASEGDKQSVRLVAERTDGAAKQVQTIIAKTDPQVEQLKKLTPEQLEHLARGLLLELEHPTLEITNG